MGVVWTLGRVFNSATPFHVTVHTISSQCSSYLATTESTNWSVDRIRGTTRGENSYCWLLYSQCGTIGVDKTQRSVVGVGGWERERENVCVCACVRACVLGRVVLTT